MFSGLTSMTGFKLWVDQNPGAPFTFTMMPNWVPGTNKLVVTVPHGAPFPMDTTLSVTGGTPGRQACHHGYCPDGPHGK